MCVWGGGGGGGGSWRSRYDPKQTICALSYRNQMDAVLLFFPLCPNSLPFRHEKPRWSHLACRVTLLPGRERPCTKLDLKMPLSLTGTSRGQVLRSIGNKGERVSDEGLPGFGREEGTCWLFKPTRRMPSRRRRPSSRAPPFDCLPAILPRWRWSGSDLAETQGARKGGRRPWAQAEKEKETESQLGRSSAALNTS